MGEMPQVGLGLVMGIHPFVHGRAEDDRSPGNQEEGREEVCGHSLGCPSQEVGRSRGYDDGIGLQTETDVKSRTGTGEEIGVNLPARNRLKRERLDELEGPTGHYDVDPGPQTSEVPGQLNGLIRGNTAGDPQDHPAPLPGASGMQDPDGHSELLVPLTPLNEAELDLTGGQCLKRAGCEFLLMTQRKSFPGQSIQLAGITGGDENAQVLALGVLCYIVGGENVHRRQVLLVTV
jgi:hypothetical protein